MKFPHFSRILGKIPRLLQSVEKVHLDDLDVLEIHFVYSDCVGFSRVNKVLDSFDFRNFIYV